MKALMSPFARSILNNPDNRDAVREIMTKAGYGIKNAVHVSVTPIGQDGQPTQPVTVAAYKVPAAQPE